MNIKYKKMIQFMVDFFLILAIMIRQLYIHVPNLISYACLLFFFIASFIEMETWLRIILIATGLIIFAFGVGYAVKIEQVAGYYECSNCHHKYVPTYKKVLWSRHMGRTRKMKCPKCGKKTWNKKILKK